MDDTWNQFGVPGQAAIDAAKAQAIAASAPSGYTQDAKRTVAMNGVLASTEVTFASIDQRGGSGVGELVLVGGRITIPAGVWGRWSVLPSVDITLGTTVTLQGRFLDAQGAAIPNSNYPKNSSLPLVAAGGFTMPNLPIVYKPEADKASVYTLQIWASAVLSVGITTVNVALTKLGN